VARPRSDAGVVVGVDLAGTPHRPSGVCVYRSPRRLEASVAHTDDELDRVIASVAPALVVVDAPLSLPRDRLSLDVRTDSHFRDCDRELQRLGIRFFPLTLGPMRMLTARGMRLAAAWRSRGLRVVEGYPGGSQDLLGLPRKQRGSELLQRALLRRGLGGPLRERPLTHDELDAVTIAWVGGEYLRGRGEEIGDPNEGTMLLPATGRRRKQRERARSPATTRGHPGAPVPGSLNQPRTSRKPRER
jgi:uncharacterized protein